ncbi:MAG: hypothetical protein U9N34_03970, partial [Candidatus Cloacimonadota bacterium]|nr:hypothetical protein [Candidatus Cloacimonadota bacterium]
AGGYRLAKFNKELEDLTVKSAFSGMPIPTAAWVIASGIIFQLHYFGKIIFGEFFLLFVLFAAFLMTSKIEFPSNLKDFFPHKFANTIKCSFIISLVFMVHYAPVVFLFWCVFYIVSSIFRNIYLSIHHKENFEIKDQR